MKSGELEKKLKVYSYIIMALFAILLIRLAVVQIFNNDIYQTQAKENRIRLLSIKAPRGEIYSREGEILATNKLVYTLTLTAQGVHNQDTVINELLKVIAPYYPELDENSIKEKIEANRLRLFEPITLIRDIPWDLVVKIEENRPKLPGVAISVEPLRDYPQGELAGSIMGYIHSITPQEIAAAAEKNIEYDLSSLIGKSGVEKAYEAELRGEPGARRVEVDSRGRPIGELVTLEPEPGNNLYLTIDTEIQKVLEKSMAEVLTNAVVEPIGSTTVVMPRTAVTVRVSWFQETVAPMASKIALKGTKVRSFSIMGSTSKLSLLPFRKSWKKAWLKS
jgi:penicillin-binding protein 2